MTKLKNISIGSYLFSFLFLLLIGIGFLCNKDTDLYGAGIAAVFGITFIGCIPFAYMVNKLYCKLDNTGYEKYSKISFKKIFFILMICYTIFFISVFPGMVHYDSQMCILQYFGVKNPLSDQVVLLNPTQLITDHHRIAYVYLIGITGLFLLQKRKSRSICRRLRLLYYWTKNSITFFCLFCKRIFVSCEVSCFISYYSLAGTGNNL